MFWLDLLQWIDQFRLNTVKQKLVSEGYRDRKGGITGFVQFSLHAEIRFFKTPHLHLHLQTVARCNFWLLICYSTNMLGQHDHIYHETKQLWRPSEILVSLLGCLKELCYTSVSRTDLCQYWIHICSLHQCCDLPGIHKHRFSRKKQIMMKNYIQLPWASWSL